ncbi:pyrroline-5-carboxylate reductase [Arthrobacter caoxuetaonis]|uniref:Pyrroline-5-carboxylate reductase n=1 Tax=Arthrobacter caoxuetaonis TaxID=2886935 RepID=A0A9X1MBT0_9MICC|nr:pyrroline-5-carboxylate reductase [Arthrobacter caoxuetaonis]MCC3281392.1 pyrroline-5-carboxylate reductase [Arthrobacter caoxuetaonis]MCC3296355.1 pyrroline-5-carboxylate reductase [Arthrobacter caoxuetaonis]USQ56800.1 pyrroline-5-carboxylate reductase [Arthrobacter caoxuetaonis]
MPTSPRISFLGCGSMNEAILGGILAGGFPKDRVTATVRRAERAAELRVRHGITVLAGSEDEAANRNAAAEADVLIVGVKPAGVRAMLTEVGPVLKPGAVVVSVAAAVPLELMEAALPAGAQVIRTMPNTPAKLGRGVTALSAGTAAAPASVELVRSLLAGTGRVVQVPEEQINAVGSVSGSGPAYAFYLAEAMAKAGAELGLEPELAVLLAAETLAGAGAMLAEPGADAAALRRAVTSPNGTTEAAIGVFADRDLPGIIAAGMAAAAERSAEITGELNAAS